MTDGPSARSLVSGDGLPYKNGMPADQHNPAEALFTKRLAVFVAVLLLGFWLTLKLLGRQVLSDSGFGLWSGAWTHDTSQWVADPYSFSHLLHGFIFYWCLLPARRWLGLPARFMIACLVEASWEIVENSPAVIERYRAATASLDYFGDSILNSTFDLVAAMLGFWIAWKLDWKWVLAAAAAIEVLCAIFVRDNLTLNVLMLFWPLESIKRWQLGG